jgi:hypothetical protein
MPNSVANSDCPAVPLSDRGTAGQSISGMSGGTRTPAGTARLNALKKLAFLRDKSRDTKPDDQYLERFPVSQNGGTRAIKAGTVAIPIERPIPAVPGPWQALRDASDRERAVEKLARELAAPKPWQWSTDPGKAMDYWRGRALSDLVRRVSALAD